MGLWKSKRKTPEKRGEKLSRPPKKNVLAFTTRKSRLKKKKETRLKGSTKKGKNIEKTEVMHYKRGRRRSGREKEKYKRTSKRLAGTRRRKKKKKGAGRARPAQAAKRRSKRWGEIMRRLNSPERFGSAAQRANQNIDKRRFGRFEGKKVCFQRSLNMKSTLAEKTFFFNDADR